VVFRKIRVSESSEKPAGSDCGDTFKQSMEFLPAVQTVLAAAVNLMYNTERGTEVVSEYPKLKVSSSFTPASYPLSTDIIG
jgi:hypothetical protein